ncbi:hypothetical protein AB9E06_33585 [Rhizobium leguminosarum]|uniref:hypothetical protein n=1 Tax=Rhizobium leguminosarum TaxID=384 RepID=UPI003F9E1F17
MSNFSFLLIEDSPAKAAALTECVLQAFPKRTVERTQTIAVASKLIEQQEWSGILLDLAFHRSNQTADLLDRPYLAGIEILQQLHELRLSYPVIIATQHASFANTKYGDFDSSQALGDRLRKVFKRNFRGLVEVDLGETDWRNEIIELMRTHFQ